MPFALPGGRGERNLRRVTAEKKKTGKRTNMIMRKE